MKYLIYILIFLPSLLFSQETKNMELVGVRSETIEMINYSPSSISFTIDSGMIYKITSAHFSYTGGNQRLILNGVSITDKDSYPIWLGQGEHTLGVSTNASSGMKGIITGLEFKLTTQ